MKYINLLIVLVCVFTLVGCQKSENQEAIAEVTDSKIETIEYDGIKLVGNYDNGLVSIKLTNEGENDVLITKVNMITYDKNNKKSNHKFETNQLLEVNKTTEMSFIQEIGEVTKIEYKITKENVDS